MERFLLEAVLRKLDHLAIVCGYEARRAEQVRLDQAALRHLGRIVFKAKMGPHEVKRSFAVGLNVPR